MIVVILGLIILSILSWGIFGWGAHAYNESYDGEVRMWVGGVLGTINAVLLLISLFCCFRWQIGTDVRTGYIYSVDEAFGEGTVHIRMGKNAGEDTQEPFCVNDENLEKARSLAGTGKKVRVTIPATGFRFENNFFACTSKVIIEEVDD